MNNEILNNNEEQPDEKELLRQRREEQIERVKAQYETDVKEKAEAKVRMEKEQELENELAPFITVRKGLIALCGLMWVFAAFCLLTGTLEMKIFLPMCASAAGEPRHFSDMLCKAQAGRYGGNASRGV